jgi:hypothetical protein
MAVMRFTIRDLFWLILCVALGLGVWHERAKSAAVAKENEHMRAYADKMNQVHKAIGLRVTREGKIEPSMNMHLPGTAAEYHALPRTLRLETRQELEDAYNRYAEESLQFARQQIERIALRKTASQNPTSN